MTLTCPSGAAEAAARARQAQLTKPPGSLGRLEDVACWLAGWQDRERPRLDSVHALVFAGNHGVRARGVSAFPQAVTAQMVANFERGGAAINQLCRTFGATLSVHPIDLDRPTADFTGAPAMSVEECDDAMRLGAEALPEAADLVLLGEMGIGNTTVAAAMATALFGGRGADWVGRGTGVDDAGLALKARVVDEAMALHREAFAGPLDILRRVGGREEAAITGAVIEARKRRIPVLLDGFVCCAAAAVAHRLEPGGLDHCLLGHRSAEAGHARLIEALGMAPLLELGMRLGEASGAAMALAVLRGALACHEGMATFAEAQVAGATGER
ncbi:MAG: nicotinate-nucleotide--dimethylbenzimidazole phosphoribosyltransferase [Geminicoccaceae bacterium]|nr:nicotinate-nucleotide--dimethylbenzimidazole phosphoribosyltransferase [Geminicoccaceae bacterium]